MRPVPAIPMPLSVQDWRQACRATATAPQQLAEQCRERHQALAAYALSSGRAALQFALETLRGLQPQRRTVILPAYTCPTVGRAVQAAALQGLCADVALTDFGLLPGAVEALLSDEVLAVVAPHLFGMACDVAPLARLCRERGVVLIEDLAQACGAQCQGQTIGTFGHLAFNSLGRSKNVRGYKGGVLWIHEAALVEPLSHAYATLPTPTASAARGQFKQLATTLCSQPELWNMARRLPLLKVGAEDQSPAEQPQALPSWQAELGRISLQRVAHYNGLRRQLAHTMLQQFAPLEGLEPQTAGEDRDSTYLRCALRVVGGGERREQLRQRLQHRGIDARSFYSQVLYDYDWWVRDTQQPACPNAARIVAENLVLPIHYGMTLAEAAQVGCAVGEELTANGN